MAGLSFTELLAGDTREEAVRHLMRVVYTTEDLVHQCKTARYNVRGLPEQPAVCAICEHTEEAMHCIAEVCVQRIQILGGTVDYTLASVQEGSDLQPFPAELRDAGLILDTIGESWRAVAELMSERISALRQINDGVSAHVLEHELMHLGNRSVKLQEVLGSADRQEAMEHVAGEVPSRGNPY